MKLLSLLLNAGKRVMLTKRMRAEVDAGNGLGTWDILIAYHRAMFISLFAFVILPKLLSGWI